MLSPYMRSSPGSCTLLDCGFLCIHPCRAHDPVNVQCHVSLSTTLSTAQGSGSVACDKVIPLEECVLFMHVSPCVAESEHCLNLAVAAVTVNSSGSQLSISVAAETTLQVDFLHCFPPEECGVDGAGCNLELVQDTDHLFAFFALQCHNLSGLAASEFSWDNVTGQYINTFVKTFAQPQNCSLTSVWSHKHQVISTCVNLNSNESYLQLYQLTSESDITSAQLTLKSEKLTIFVPLTLSPFLYTANQRSPCTSRSHLNYVDGGYLVQVPLDGEYVKSYDLVDKELDDRCEKPYRGLEYHQGKIVVQCSGPHALSHEPCEDEIDRQYPGVEVYPCANLEDVAIVTGGTVHLEGPNGERNSEDIDLPWSAVNDSLVTQCLSLDSQEAVCAFVLSNGSTFLLNFTSKQFTEVTHANRSGLYSSHKPAFHQSLLTLLNISDLDSLALRTINLSCPEFPVVASLHVPAPPVLTSVLVMDGTHPCQCAGRSEADSENPDVTDPSTNSSAGDTTKNDTTASPSASITPSPSETSSSASESSTIPVPSSSVSSTPSASEVSSSTTTGVSTTPTRPVTVTDPGNNFDEGDASDEGVSGTVIAIIVVTAVVVMLTGLTVGVVITVAIRRW